MGVCAAGLLPWRVGCPAACVSGAPQWKSNVSRSEQDTPSHTSLPFVNKDEAPSLTGRRALTPLVVTPMGLVGGTFLFLLWEAGMATAVIFKSKPHNVGCVCVRVFFFFRADALVGFPAACINQGGQGV